MGRLFPSPNSQPPQQSSLLPASAGLGLGEGRLGGGLVANGVWESAAWGNLRRSKPPEEGRLPKVPNSPLPTPPSLLPTHLCSPRELLGSYLSGDGIPPPNRIPISLLPASAAKLPPPQLGDGKGVPERELQTAEEVGRSTG